jgi:hypothetical protein
MLQHAKCAETQSFQNPSATAMLNHYWQGIEFQSNANFFIRNLGAHVSALRPW